MNIWKFLFSYRLVSTSSFDGIFYGSEIIDKTNSSKKNINKKNSNHFATWTQEEANEVAAENLVALNTEKLTTESCHKFIVLTKKKVMDSIIIPEILSRYLQEFRLHSRKLTLSAKFNENSPTSF